MGGPRPPGPPMVISQEEILSRLGIKRKKQWTVEGPIKRTNWKQVPAQKLTKDSFWTKVDEEKLVSKSLIENLTNKFGTKPASKKVAAGSDGAGPNGTAGGGGKKKVKELKVLDAKSAQNLSIMLNGPVKHMSYEELKKCILRCDTTVLTENLLQSLIQYIPAPDQLNRLEEFEKEYDNLPEAEQFSISISGIKRLVPRLKSLMFQQRYPELVQDCKPHIVAATAACEEVRKSKKFAKMLEIILLIGNIMNTGSKNAQSIGFDISYLAKLNNTKDRDNNGTLLHFLVELVERDHPELLSFEEEILHLDPASRVSVESIQKVLKQMDNSIKNLETDLKNAARTAQEKDDRFVEAMGAFCEEARKQCDILQNMFKNMEKLYCDLESYYVFDKQKYTLEEFMSDVKAFKDQFKDAHNKIIKDREAQAKQARAKEAREKQERERAERAEKRRAIVDFNAPDDQEGVMDSLLEALKTGSAFNRDQKRKRAPRAAGAERRAQLNRSRSRGPSGMTSEAALTKQIVDILNGNENDPSANVAAAAATATATPHAGGGGSHDSGNGNAVDMASSILTDNGGGARSSRPRRPRSQATSAGAGREREFTGGGGPAVLTNGNENNNEETDALLRKLRNL